MNGEDASGRLSGVPVIPAGRLRVAVASVTAGRPVQALVAPAVRGRVQPTEVAAGAGGDPNLFRITAIVLMWI